MPPASSWPPLKAAAARATGGGGGPQDRPQGRAPLRRRSRPPSPTLTTTSGWRCRSASARASCTRSSRSTPRPCWPTLPAAGRSRAARAPRCACTSVGRHRRHSRRWFGRAPSTRRCSRTPARGWAWIRPRWPGPPPPVPVDPAGPLQAHADGRITSGDEGSRSRRLFVPIGVACWLLRPHDVADDVAEHAGGEAAAHRRGAAGIGPPASS